MAGDNIEFFRKFTTLVAGTYYSDPYEVASQKSLMLQVLYAKGIGTSPTLTAQLQQSTDLQDETFINMGSGLEPAETETATGAFPELLRFVRLKIVVGGTGGAAVTFWAKAVVRDV